MASHVHATLLAIILHEMFVCECQVALFIRILLSVFFVIVCDGFYKHLSVCNGSGKFGGGTTVVTDDSRLRTYTFYRV